MVNTRSQQRLVPEPAVAEALPSSSLRDAPPAAAEALPSSSLRDAPPKAPEALSSSNFKDAPPTALPRERYVHSVTTSKSASTVKARILAAEAQYARRLAEAQRIAAEAELRAEIAAIEAETSSRGTICSSSHSAVQEWLDVTSVIGENLPENDSQIPNTCVDPPQPAQASGLPQLPIRGGGQSQQLVPRPQPYAGVGSSQRPDRVSRRPTSEMAAQDQAVGSSPADNAVEPAVLHLTKALELFVSNVGAKNKAHSSINLPFFDGKSPADWLSFKRVFEGTAASFTAVENLARLTFALRGSAREAVSVLLVSAREPAEVMRALEMRFGRPELIVLQEIAAVRALPRVSADGKDLATFACRVRNCVEIIRLLNQEDYLYSPELFNVLISKIPTLLRTRWVDYADLNLCGNRTKLELFGNFLSREVDLHAKFGSIFEQSTSLPAFDYNKRSRDKVNSVSENYNNHNRTPMPKVSSKSVHSENEEIHCIFCEGAHDITQCHKFKSLTVDDRWVWIKQEKVCHRCLKKGLHRYRFCRTKELCNVKDCVYRHHKLFHNFEQVNNFVGNTHEDAGPEKPSTSGSKEVKTGPEIPSVSGFKEVKALPTPEMQSEVTVAHAATSPKASDSLGNSRPLLKIVAVTVTGPAGSVDTYALLDDGSTATFIDAEIASRIGVKGAQGQVHLDCVGGLSKETKVQYVDFKIKGLHSSETHVVRNARAISDLGMARQSVLRCGLQQFPYLSDLADVLTYDDAKPMILIGMDNWHLTVSRLTRRGTRSQPVAINTALGWVLFGFGCSKSKPVELVNHTTLHEADDLDAQSYRLSLENLIKEQYKLDAVGIVKHESRNIDDKRAVQILQRTAHRLPSGRFEVGLLWRSDNLVVPNSYGLALSRFLSLERKMHKDPEYAERYRQNINDTLKKGYAEECTNTGTSTCWYLPHFGVTNPNKPGKLRVVHDAAAKSSGVSLNSLLLTGPDLLQPLLHILLRFREEKIAMTADIKEMFPQVKILEKDRDAQRFLWRDRPDTPIKIYRMSSMIFGAASSPSTALYIKDKNAMEAQDQYPDAAHAILHDHYMDDYIGSVATVKSAAKLAADIISVHDRAGFEMRGWVSNDPTALSLIPKDRLLLANTDVDLGSLHTTTTVRTLGLIWQPAQDVIGFNIGLKEEQGLPDRLTKRNVLSHVMRVYDPVGFLAPIIIRGRIMLQEAWRKALDWDEELSQVDSQAWRDWFMDLLHVSKLKIPRRYNLRDFEVFKRELHIFSDASGLGYAAVAYWRFVYADGNVKLALVSSKARVASLSSASIPKLELQGALVAARLADTICEAHRYKPSRRIFWCDSMTVIWWLRKTPKKIRPYVAHRIGEILELTNHCEWRWVPGSLNVADDATRIKRGTLTPESRWISGPQFLISENDWPTETPFDLPRDSCHCTIHNNGQVSSPQRPLSADPSRFSSWRRLVRATATAHQFITLLRRRSFFKRGFDVSSMQLLGGCLCTFIPFVSGRPSSRHSLPLAKALNAQDLHLAEVHVLRQSQEDSFRKEIINLRSGRPVPPHGRLHGLSPYIGKDNLLRLLGRIASVKDVDEEVKFPVILDGKHPAVRLLVLDYHQKATHANTEMVVNELRQRYWILSLRNVVRSVAYNCQFCRLRRASPLQPPMGDLPEARLAHHRRPFSFVGLDYFGPVQVAVGRRREKRYVALYTCLVSRAVHLELVNSLSTDAAIMSLRRFIARRGTPAQIYSDNGTAFVGARRVMRALYGEAAENFAANEAIEWRFIPPAAPFMGGAWERLVRSVKTALKVTLRDRTPREEVLTTLLAEAEATVNSRPLTHISPDPEYPEALTPFHLIYGSSSGRSIPYAATDSDLNCRVGWRKAMRLADHFWRRWVAEYLPTLLPRRSGGSAPNLAVGDPVLVVDSGLPRGTWPKGRIQRVYPGTDGTVRVVDVRTSAGLILKRPAKKIVLLPV